MGTIYNFFKPGTKKEPEPPPPRSIFQEGSETLGALQKLTPEQVALQQELLSKYGPQIAASVRGIFTTPDSEKLSGELNRQATEELAAGSSLTPSLRRELEQYTRAGAASRGFGYGPNDLTEEVFTLGSAGQALKGQRQQFAGNVLGLDQRTNEVVGQGTLSRMPSMADMSPFNPYSEDLYNTNFNAGWSNLLATRNYNAAIRGAVIGAVGQLDASIIGAAGKAGACWVAREVFGEESLLWRIFERWLICDAPAWFRWCYLRFGERVARWLRDKPRLKALVRRWMAGRIWSRLEKWMGQQ